MRSFVLIGIVLLSALARLAPHPPNFTPIAALALFGAARFRSRWAGFLVPLGALLVSDVALEVAGSLGLLSGWLAHGTGLYREMPFIYAAFVLVGGIGLLLRERQSVAAVAAATGAGAVVFFLVTNFAVWALGSMGYVKTLGGLLECYEMALPFFRNSLLGDAFYATVLFGGFALAERWAPTLRTASRPSWQSARQGE